MKKSVVLWIVILASNFIAEKVYADDLQKVIILPFKNISKDPNYAYLENTITDSIRETLKKKFAFEEASERDWKSVSKKNYLFDDECFTASYGLNLGLLSNQDVIINGGFLVKESVNDESVISTVVRIISITEKRIVSESVIDIPANNKLFQAIDEVSDKAAKEAAKVLPNKEDWEKNKSKKKVAKKLFSNISLGIRGGANMYFEGWADQFQTKLPAFGFLLRANMPVISEKFFLQASFSYFQHELIPDSANYFTANDLTLLATNLMIGGAMGVDIKLGDYFLFSPKLGGGIINQSTQVSGAVSQTVTNNIPYASAGFEITWLATESLKVVLDATFNAQIEDYPDNNTTVITYFPLAMLGINIGF